MEVQEEAITQVSVSKGKRTKRQKSLSPFLLTMAPTSSYSSTSEGSDSAGGSGGVVVDRLINTASDPSSVSGEFITQTNSATVVDEEADMANCLILLAQGRRSQKSPAESHHVLAAVSKVATVAGGSEVYQCKTCNRCFPSFQALGGHRASHKKPKATVTYEEKRHVSVQEKKFLLEEGDDNTTLSLQIRSGDIHVTTTTTTTTASYNTPTITNKSRVHECSICGAEFSSGQALGGHMRRHRPIMMTTTTSSNGRSSHDEEAKKKPRTVLSLDLNLPAPEDDHLHHHRESKFPFAPKEQVIVFSASPLVDCHY